MRVMKTNLPGVLLVEPRVFGDERGFFMETFQAQRYEEIGITGPFVQDNLSFSRKGVLRGLHFQNPSVQGKLVYVLEGEVFDVVVDVRCGSPTFGQWVGYTLSARDKRQIWVPAGFAHGFCVTGDSALFAYKCTDYYNPETEVSIRWDDPGIGIHWPIQTFSLCPRDAEAPTLEQIESDRLPSWVHAV